MMQAIKDCVSVRGTVRRAFSVVELLVAFAISIALMSMLLYAVSAARESSRLVSCQNNCRQLGVAFLAYESTHGTFPSGWVYESARSPFYEIAPFLEIETRGVTPSHWQSSSAKTKPISVLSCPSDEIMEGTNYRVSMGDKCYPRESFRPKVETARGVFTYFFGNGFESILDGSSYTAICSERLKGSGGIHGDRNKIEFGNIPMDWSSVLTREQLITTFIPGGKSYKETGKNWMASSFFFTWYNHVNRPNTFLDFVVEDGFHISPPQGGVVSASSNHPHGVNMLNADGSVHFVDENITLDVWRSFGSKAGSD